MNEILEHLGREEEYTDPPKEEEKDKTTLELEEFLAMLNADSKDGNFVSKDSDEFEDRDYKIKPGKVSEKIGEYSDEIVDDAKKNPEKYFVETPRGKMTLKKAIMQGWNPATGKFDQEDIESTIKEGRDKLNLEDRELIEQLTNPANAGIAPADGEVMGLPEGDPMMAGVPEDEPDPLADIPPEILQTMLQGGGM